MEPRNGSGRIGNVQRGSGSCGLVVAQRTELTVGTDEVLDATNRVAEADVLEVVQLLRCPETAQRLDAGGRGPSVAS